MVTGTTAFFLGLSPCSAEFFSIVSQWFLNILSKQAWAAGQPRLGLTEDLVIRFSE